MFNKVSRQVITIKYRTLINLIVKLIIRDKKDYISEFNKKFADYLNVKHSITFTSSRAGLYHLLKSLDFIQGDEIILQSYTFYVMPAIVILAGLKPVFVDNDPNTFNIDPELIEAKITPRTKAIIITHMHGYPADMQRIMAIAEKHKLRVIEDCAHSCGAEFEGKKTGSFDIGCFSFGMAKNLSMLTGGTVTTNDQVLYDKLKSKLSGFKVMNDLEFFKQILINMVFKFATDPLTFGISLYHVLKYQAKSGKIIDYSNVSLYKDVPSSFFSRPHNLMGYIGLLQLNELKCYNDTKIDNASFVLKNLPANIQIQKPCSNSKPIYTHLPIVTNNAVEIIKRAILQGMDVQRDYCNSSNRLNIFKDFHSNDTPVADKLHNRIIYLINHPYIKKPDLMKLINIIAETKNIK